MNLPPDSKEILRRRCAIYTRKSTEEGLDMEFNSLDAQREACLAYVTSQKAEGWVSIREPYDDGGFSGGTLDRPALQRLLSDVEVGLVDVIVVYKIDRLSRSLMDFARLVEILDRHNVTFVSVTQSFNTTTSMGRLTLNILLSFAQFEREVIGERIRDKFSASRKRGMWMGGYVPFGYDVQNRKLIVNETEANVVRYIFKRFIELGSATKLAHELADHGVTNKRGKQIDKGFIYKLIQNRLYLGEAVHKGDSYPGEHDPIVSNELWDAVHAALKQSPRERGTVETNRPEPLLRGILFTESGAAMTPTYTRKGDRLYHYYVSTDVARGRVRADQKAPTRLSAPMVENAVVAEMRRMIKAPEIASQVIQNFRQDGMRPNETEIITTLKRFDPLWDALYPRERARITRLLVERVTVAEKGIAVDLRRLGIGQLVHELSQPSDAEVAA
jgi:DNA invertase Pin-like site-specific DNA recombinase